MSQTLSTPVAVIGMACRLPGGIDSPERLWEALLGAQDLVTGIPADRWDADEYYDPDPGVPGRSLSKWGAFLDDVAGFDAEFFSIGEREAAAIDPQHRVLLEASWEALEHAGLDPSALAGSSTGVFTGICHHDYVLFSREAGALEDAYGFTGTAYSMASGRTSYALGLQGPAITVDTSCSSALLAVHMACRSLQCGETDLALAGGCALLLDPSASASASAQGMLSPSGHCRPFDAAADGFVRSEGCAVVVLKRLSDAQSDGDRILAVVRGTAANQDGRSETITMPSSDAQAAVYRSALAAAGVDADTIGVVEAHGTGTPVGDPIEYRSLARVYGVDNRCLLGSAKSNLGHTESAAGAIGLIKAVLSLQHGVVPPMLHFTQLPDDLAQIDTRLVVPQKVTAWPTNGRQGPRRAAVSSYGMSGTNVHAILEQAPDQALDAATHNGISPGPGALRPMMFPLSSSSADALRQTSRRLADWVEQRPESMALPDLAYTLARRRAHRPVRTAVVASGIEDLIAGLREIACGETPYQPAVGQDDRGPVWIFSGQGSQWASMGADLLATEPVFAALIEAAEPLIAAESGFSVTDAMKGPDTVTGIHRVQPTLFAMQVALAATMSSYGVRPGAVIGHSMGEVAAAVVAGALSLEDGVRVICRRSRLLTRLVGAGAMASVELPAQRVREELTARGLTDVTLAVVASPQSTVVGGATQTIHDLVAAWEAQDVMARTIAVDVASHSPQVDPILPELADALAELHPKTPEIAYYSATLFDPRERPTCDGTYWADNLRHTVRFGAAVRAALEDGYRVFAELAPHPLLTRAVEQGAQSFDMPIAALAAMRRTERGTQPACEQAPSHGLRGFLTDLHAAGAAIDFSLLYPSGRLVDAPLPAWDHRHLLLDRDGRDHKTPGASTIAVHPLLGPHVRLREEPERHAWQAEVGTKALPWLADHRVHQVAAFPGAAYCEMALAAAHATLGAASEVRELRFEQMLLLDDETPVAATASVQAPGVIAFEVETDHDGEHARRATAVLHAVDDEQRSRTHDVSALFAAHPQRADGTELRQWFDTCGVQFGPAFTGLAAAHTGEADTVLAEIVLPRSIRGQLSAYRVHPALLDACFQSVAALEAIRRPGAAGLMLPLSVRRLRAHGSTRNARYCYARLTVVDGVTTDADVDVLDEHGTVLLSVRGLLMGSGVSESDDCDRLLGERLLTVDWQRRELPEVSGVDAGRWLLISASDDVSLPATRLTHALKSRGAECTAMSWAQSADHPASAELLQSRLGSGGFTGVVILPGLRNDDPDLQSLTRGREQVRHLVRIARELAETSGQPPRLYLVTMHAQTVLPQDRPNLEQAGLRGLLRVIGAEHPHLRTTQIDADEETEAEQLAAELLTGSPEDETAWRDGEWYAARLCPDPLGADERRTTVIDYERDAARLQVRMAGDLESMELVAFHRNPPGPGQIEVAVTASSVNFADVLVAMGRFPSVDGVAPELGMDFAGVVTAVGPDVSNHQVGDRVGGFSGNGCWATFVTCDAHTAASLPPGLTDRQAAAVSTAHATAWYGLHDQARITSGDRVLIHSATGGVGQAAVAIARAAGAEIFATAGSLKRRQLLRDMGIEHVYDSRSIEFAEQIRHDTDGYGVDIVLNSLTGVAQRAGFELLAIGGRFVEIGKHDVYANARLGLFPFRRNLTFHYVDLALMSNSHPQRIGDLLRTVYRLVADAELPLPEYANYPFVEAATAIRVMSGAEHTGKLILDVPHTGSRFAVVPPNQARIFRSDGAYIVTGGLGGLGLFLAEAMAAAGCGRIVLSSRSQPTPETLAIVDFIRSMGTDVAVACGDIAEPDTASRLVTVATATGLPLRGVLHAAAVVEDATLANITDRLIDRDWAPKVYGVWNLHTATAGQPLDWFCSFSSAAALLGSPGQGAYAAANSWLDAFTIWRRAEGLPASAIAWGAWAEIGRGAFLADGAKTTMITPDEGAYAFQTMLRHDRAYTGYTPFLGTPWLTALTQRSPFAEVFRSLDRNSTDTSKFRVELNALPSDEWPTRLRRLVSEQVSLILRRSVDPDRVLSEYGLDSLGNLELRTRIETETGIRINSMDITTIRGLAQHLNDTLALAEVAPTAS